MIRPKEKKERALGVHLHLKGARCNSPKCALVRKPYKPGAHGNAKGRRRTVSDFGRQISEKQKFKLTYGINEKNLHTLFMRAAKSKTGTSTKLLELMERRLDNTVFHLGVADSHSMARQLVRHGHIFVNKKRVRSPGYTVNKGDSITLRELSAGKNIFKNIREKLKGYEPPAWLSLNKESLEGKVVSLPEAETPFEISLLVESFSK